jgi:hypothetical protein
VPLEGIAKLKVLGGSVFVDLEVKKRNPSVLRTSPFTKGGLEIRYFVSLIKKDVSYNN